MAELYPYCQFAALKLALGCAVAIPRGHLRIFDTPNGRVVKVRAVGAPARHFLDARRHAASPSAYGVLVSTGGRGIYAPVGRQNVHGYIGPVPICVGGGRDMELTANGLVDETDREVVEREAQEEIMQALDIKSTAAFALAGVNATYLRVDLNSDLSRVYYSWDVNGSDQVVAMRWWPLPYPGEVSLVERGADANPLLALRMYNNLGCSVAHRPTWAAEWHGRAYQAVINQMLQQSVALRPAGMHGEIDPLPLNELIAHRTYVYHNTYAPFPNEPFIGHTGPCPGHCNFPPNC